MFGKIGLYSKTVSSQTNLGMRCPPLIYHLCFIGGTVLDKHISFLFAQESHGLDNRVFFTLCIFEANCSKKKDTMKRKSPLFYWLRNWPVSRTRKTVCNVWCRRFCGRGLFIFHVNICSVSFVAVYMKGFSIDFVVE